jgi:NADH-quinone oxidoreductase subunit N
VAVLALAAVMVAGVAVVVTGRPDASPGPIAGGMLVIDGLATFFRLLVLTVSALILVMAVGPLGRGGGGGAELAAMVLFADLGAFLAASAAHFASLFVGIELVTMAVIVLVACAPGGGRANDRALKIFVPNAALSAVMLYGVSLVYGAVGSLELAAVRLHLEVLAHVNSMVVLGVVLIACGLFFKVAAVPFHLWLPAVVGDAPARVSAFVAVVPTIAGLACLVRLSSGAFSPVTGQWWVVMWIASAAAMIFGSVAALVQDRVKWMLADLWIAHAGYALMGVAAGTDAGTRAVLVQAAVAGLVFPGAFGMVALLESRERSEIRISDLSRFRSGGAPAVVGIVVFAGALAGIPLTAGFVGRWFLWAAALEAGLVWLVVLSLVATVVGFACCARVVVPVIVFDSRPEDASGAAMARDGWTVAAVTLCGLAIVVVGLWPVPLVEWAVGAIGRV